jgi:hypothetical protein
MTDNVIEEYQRRSRRAAIRAAIGGFVVILSLVFAVFELRKTQDNLVDQQQRSNSLGKELTEKDQALSETRKRANSINEVFNGTLVTVDSKDPRASAIVTQALQETLQRNPSAARNVPILYLHTRRPDQRQQAMKVAELLRSSGFLVPTVDNKQYSGNTPEETQLHFDGVDSRTAGDAEKIVQVLQTAGYKVTPVKTPIKHNEPRAYGLWFGNDLPPSPQ